MLIEELTSVLAERPRPNPQQGNLPSGGHDKGFESKEESVPRVVEDRIEISAAARQALARIEALKAALNAARSASPGGTLQEIRHEFEEQAADFAEELGNKFRAAEIEDTEPVVLYFGDDEFTVSGDHPALSRIDALFAADPALAARFASISQAGSILAAAETLGEFAREFAANTAAAVDTLAQEISEIETGIHFLYENGGLTALLGLPGGAITWWSTADGELES